MTPLLVDHAHTDSCIVIGCNLAEKRTRLFLVAVTSQLHHCRSHKCEHDIARCCITLHGRRSRSHITVVIVNNALRPNNYYHHHNYYYYSVVKLLSKR